MNYIADQSYLVIKEEASEGVPVKPNVFLPLESADFRTQMNYEADQRMKGIIVDGLNLARKDRKHEGLIKVWADPDNLGHVLNMFLKHGSPSGSAPDGYTHPFTLDAPKTYTIELPRGQYAQRFFGVKGDELSLIFEDSMLKAEMNVKAQGQFSVGSLAAALTGAGMTSLTLKQDYDLEPNRGLLVGDVIVVGGVEITITSVDADGVTVGFGSISVTASIGDPVYLKAQDVVCVEYQNPFYFGDMLVGFGADASAAETAADSKTTDTPVHELKLTIRNNLLDAPASASRDVSKLLPRNREIELEIKQLFEDPTERQKYLDLTKRGIAIVMRGQLIKTTAPTTRNEFAFTLHNARAIDSSEPLEKGEYIFDDQVFRGLHDVSDGKAITCSLVNKTSDYN